MLNGPRDCGSVPFESVRGVGAVGRLRTAAEPWLTAVDPDGEEGPGDGLAVSGGAGGPGSGRAGGPHGAVAEPASPAGQAGGVARQPFATAARAAAEEAAATHLEAGRVEPATAEGRAAGVASARGVAAAGLAEETRTHQQAALGELLAYFSGVGAGVADLEPDDLVSYVMDHWLEAHRSRGGGLASPASVDSLFGNLSGALARCGRVGPYQPATGVGNPVDSVVVSDFKAGFRQHALEEGGRRAVQLGAVRFQERVRQLVRGIRAHALDLLRPEPEGGSVEVRYRGSA